MFAGATVEQSDDNQTLEKVDGMLVSKVSLRGFEYSELNRQTEQGEAKYYHRFVSGSGENSSCYEFTLAVKSRDKQLEGESASVGSEAHTSQVGLLEKKDDFARLQKILASVKIKADSEPAKVVASDPVFERIGRKLVCGPVISRLPVGQSRIVDRLGHAAQRFRRKTMTVVKTVSLNRTTMWGVW